MRVLASTVGILEIITIVFWAYLCKGSNDICPDAWYCPDLRSGHVVLELAKKPFNCVRLGIVWDSVMEAVTRGRNQGTDRFVFVSPSIIHKEQIPPKTVLSNEFP